VLTYSLTDIQSTAASTARLSVRTFTGRGRPSHAMTARRRQLSPYTSQVNGLHAEDSDPHTMTVSHASQDSSKSSHWCWCGSLIPPVVACRAYATNMTSVCPSVT